MASSISPSSPRLPRLALWLLGVALAAWASAAVWATRGQPETRFVRQAAELKIAWAKKLTREHGSKIIVFGGSSCSFSIDGERLLTKHGLPTANFGLIAGIGPKVLTEFALRQAQRGDTLVAAIEPGLLTEDISPTASAVQFCQALGAPELLRGQLAPRFANGPSTWLDLRPGAYSTFTFLGKALRGQPAYRYAVTDIQPSGLMQTSVRVPMTGRPGSGPTLSSGARELLASLAAWGQTNGVKVRYALPWAWCPTDEAAQFRRDNAGILEQVAHYLPVLREENLGAVAENTYFADTAWHLTAEGVVQRTDALAQLLKADDAWTIAELQLRRQGK